MLPDERNLLIHEYGEVKKERIWEIASVSILDLLNILEALIPPIEE